MGTEPQVLVVADVAAWSEWLGRHWEEAEGVWLVLAKKGTVEPTALTYEEALAVALCHGWVDGQLAKGEPGTFRRRFTPRRPGSAWSKRNVALASRLREEGRMGPGGHRAIERAKADGSWERAYDGQASMEVPPDLAQALAADRAALATFDQLDAANRYSVLYRVVTATPAARPGRVAKLVVMLGRGEAPHRARQGPDAGA